MDFIDLSYVIESEVNKFIKYEKFRHEKLDSNKYELFGLGYDGKPKTDDDILPEILITDTSKTELIRYRIKGNHKIYNQ